MNRRRIIIIALAILILALVGTGLYWFLGGSSDPADETAGNLPEIGGEFEVSEEGPDEDEILLAEATIPGESVAAYRALGDDVVVMVHKDGTIDRVVSSTVTALSAKPVDNFASASFSRDGSRILVLTGNQPRSQVNIFEVSSATWRVIPGTFRDATWGPTGSQLATLTPDPATGKTAVAIYDAATGRTVRTLAVLALGDVSVSWPSPQKIVVSDRPIAASKGSAWTVDTATGRVALAARGNLGFSAVWNKDASAGIAFQSSAQLFGGRTKLYEGGLESAVLSFTTIPEKCTFFDMPASESSTTPFVICGVPREQGELQTRRLPDSYLRREFFSDDVLVGVNLETRTVDFTISTPTSVDATDLQVIGTTVYYLDRADGQVFKSEI